MNSILLSLRTIAKTYRTAQGPIHALHDVTLDIIKGEIISLLGVNGAGKSTLSAIIATQIPATSGEIFFNGKSVMHDLYPYRKALGFCPQKPNFYSLLTVEQNLVIAGKCYGMSQAEAAARAGELMEQFELTRYAHHYASVLSGGYKQRLLIARSLMHRPSLVLFDEPTVALDPQVRHQLWDIIKELKAQGVTVVLTTHYLDEAEELSDRVCILDKGVIKLVDTPENLKSKHHEGSLEDVFIKILGASHEQ